jgi:hypothetical protein
LPRAGIEMAESPSALMTCRREGIMRGVYTLRY